MKWGKSRKRRRFIIAGLLVPAVMLTTAALAPPPIPRWTPPRDTSSYIANNAILMRLHFGNAVSAKGSWNIVTDESGVVRAGKELGENVEYWSKSKESALIFEKEKGGRLVLRDMRIKGYDQVWWKSPNAKPGSRATFGSDGKLAIRDGSKNPRVVWVSPNKGDKSSTLVIEDRNLVIKNKKGEVVWRANRE
ncbi:hypothetical protein [Streptomyces aureoversilis]|uniref:Bulb-type lectin domain-containing protein n=1 Tax=Streptomyces aureoversilis TaxID=67277 RepID=A0ABW0A7Z5_9ACTN